jgi:ABC-type multidrug transport system fused ATPase/permease subunit
MRAKAISYWGKDHPTLTRLILILLNGILCILALALGLLAFLYEVEIPGSVKYILAGLAVLSLLIYPSKYANIHFIKYSYWRRKRMDFILSFLGFLLLATLFNGFLSEASKLNQEPAYAQQVVYKPKTFKEKWKQKVNGFPMVKEYRAFKKQIKQEARLLQKELKVSNQNDESWKAIVLTLLILIGAYLAGSLIALLACSLACNGSEALALIVLVFGWLAVIYLGFIGIRASFRRYNKKQVKKEKSTQEGWEPY